VLSFGEVTSSPPELGQLLLLPSPRCRAAAAVEEADERGVFDLDALREAGGGVDD
jgi:hypothetical protein